MPGAHDYQFILRSLTTLADGGDLLPGDVIGSWTRRRFGGGSFSLTLPLEARNTDGTLRYTRTRFADHTLVEIIRDGAREFLGVIDTIEVDGLAKTWTVGGPDLTAYFLSQRIVGETTSDAETGAAETVALAYIEAYMGASAALARRATTYLGSLTFTIPATSGRGTTVYERGQRRNLLDVVQDASEAGGVYVAIDINAGYTGYEVEVSEPTDRTVGNGSVQFSVDWGNVEALKFRRDLRNHRNHLYVAGEGSGDTREVTEIEDATSVTAHGRREVVIDARYATTADERTTVGNLEVARRSRQTVVVAAKPHRASANSEYRTDWDVGDAVTFAEERLQPEAVDLYVEAATVSLRMAGGREPAEDITFELGEHRGDSVLRKLINAVARLQATSAV